MRWHVLKCTFDSYINISSLFYILDKAVPHPSGSPFKIHAAYLVSIVFNSEVCSLVYLFIYLFVTAFVMFTLWESYILCKSVQSVTTYWYTIYINIYIIFLYTPFIVEDASNFLASYMIIHLLLCLQHLICMRKMSIFITKPFSTYKPANSYKPNGYVYLVLPLLLFFFTTCLQLLSMIFTLLVEFLIEKFYIPAHMAQKYSKHWANATLCYRVCVCVCVRLCKRVSKCLIGD